MSNNIVPVIVEIPKGSSNKYEYDFVNKRIVLDRVLYGSNIYPGEYGSIENTLDWDGDALDVIALSNFPTVPGCQINVRILGALEMIDAGDIDTKLFGVIADDPRFDDIKTINDVGKHIKDEIKNFFMQYKALQNKEVIVKDWKDEKWALKELAHCKDLYDKYSHILLKDGKKAVLELLKKENSTN